MTDINNSGGPYTKAIADRDNNHEKRLKAIVKREGIWNCLYPGCTRKSIFSHAISESISLAKIAENEHLATIESRRYKNTKILKFGDISIHDATAFNGFCEEHDGLFSELDLNEISNVRGLVLQAYRSVISECANESRMAELSQSNYSTCDARYVASQINADRFPHAQSDESIALINSAFLAIANTHRIRAAELMKLPKELLAKLALVDSQPLGEFCVVTTEQLSHYIIYKQLPFKMPVALNCILPNVANGINLDFYFTVIPYEHSTFIMGIIPKEVAQSVLDRLTYSFSSEVAGIDLVESLMVSCNDWYMTPSTLAEMPAEKREVFLQDSIFINEHRFYEDYDMTLFDGFRRKLAEARPELQTDLKLDKISSIPRRESYEVRNKRMLDMLFNQPIKAAKLHVK